VTRVEQPNTWSCLAACACMITGEPIQALYSDIGHDGSELVTDSPYADGRRGFRLCEITRYLAGKGFNLGLPTLPHLQDVHQFPALVIVEGASYNHAVIVVDGMAIDPAPHMAGAYPISSYAVVQWWPIVQVETEVL